MRLASLLLVLLLPAARLAAAGGQQYPEPEFQHWQQLANWEERQLRKADEAWGDGKAGDKRWRLAAARYAAFCDEFPESVAFPYALYRQGRCHHLDNKRKLARQFYDDIIEFFPDDAAFGCAAAFYKGLSYVEDTDFEKAMPVWALIPKDSRWRRQPLAGYAILKLSEHLWQKGQPEKAVGYLRQMALDFRYDNADAAAKAIDRVLEFHVRLKPGEPELRAFFIEARGFGRTPLRGNDVITDEMVLTGRYRDQYWRTLRQKINHYLHRSFPQEQAAQRKAFARYWADVMRGKNDDLDDFQLYQAYLDREASGSAEGFVKRLDEIFASRYRPGDVDRVLRWMGYHLRYETHRGDGTKFKEYFQKLDWSKMQFGHLRRALELAYSSPKDPELLAGIVKQKIRLDQCTDAELGWLAGYLYRKEDKPGGLAAARAIRQPALAIATEFKLVSGDAEVPLEAKEGLAEKLYKEEQYASETWWTMADLYRKEKLYPQAINAYHRSGQGAKSGFAAAECHWETGKLTPAVAELEAIVGMFPKDAPRALLTMARYYDKKSRHVQRNEALIRILTGFKETREWSAAHVWAEDLHLKFRGETERD